MNRITLLAAVLVLFATSIPSVHAQDRSARERDLLVSLDVGYNTAFRDRSWVPVTVDIVNEQRDFEGYIEIRTFDFSNQQQSPSYILPAQCPKNSRKRFTLYAYVDGADRVEAWLFERGRRALDVPAYMKVQPIGEDDVLLLVLDDDPFNYGFLYAAVQRDGKVVRVSRHGLPTSDLERLPDIPQAYEAFDAIVFGDIDPERVAQRHRTLIENYVAQGGTLIVSTGANAVDYRGSWIEPLLGVTIGETALTTELALADAIPETTREGLRPERQAVYASLHAGSGVQSAGVGQSLALRRRLGQGNVYTIPIDATSHALQDTPGYQALWRDMLSARAEPEPQLNYEGFSNALVSALPNLSGVKIRPLGWVMTYLLLYLGVGVVANWLFWNLFKRREMAWLCLIGFSIAFTAYAMLFGRSGNLREAQQQTVGVVQIGADGTRAKVSAVTGILSSRTRTYSGTIDGERPVVRDAATRSTTQISAFSGMPGTVLNTRPFGWVQSEPNRIESLRIGASELRMVIVEGEERLDGGFNGIIERDAGGIRGEVINQTGYPLREAALVFDGTFFPMQVSGDRITIALNLDDVNRWRTDESRHPNQLQYLPYNWGIGADQVWNTVQMGLFTDESYQFDYELPPYVLAWSDDPPGVGLVPDQVMTSASARTLIAARVTLSDLSDSESDVPLAVNFGSEWLRSRDTPPMRFGQVATSNMAGPLRIRLPRGVDEDSEGELVVYLYWGMERDEFRAILAPKPEHDFASEGDAEWHRARLLGDESVTHGYLRFRSTYRVVDWREHLRTQGNDTYLEFGVSYSRSRPEDEEDRKFRDAGIHTWGEYSATALWIPQETGPEQTGVWPTWR